jgi:hypothetical protein
MSTLKTVVNIGLEAIPEGKALSKAMDAAVTAAKLSSYVYDQSQDPSGAFDFWLSPCGGDSLVPDDIKKAFGILNQVADGASDFKNKVKQVKKATGKKGDKGNPK